MSFFPCCKEVGVGGDDGATHTIINIGNQAEWYVIATGPNPFELRTAESSDGSVAISQLAATVDFIVDFAGNVTNINVGGFAEWYRVTTGPNPFEFRTAQSSDGSVAITTNTNDLDFVVDFAGNVTLANVGGFAEVWKDPSGPNPFELRTLQSSDGSVTITENADDIDFVVEPGAGSKVFQIDSTATVLTDSNTLVTLTTLAGDAKVLDGEAWKINMCVMVCSPQPLGSTLTNAETVWSIETSAGVFTVFDFYSVRDQISITGNQQSSPRHRTKNLVAEMDSPRMLVEVRRTTAGTSDFLWEHPRWGGVIIEPAP